MKEAGFTTVRLGHLCWDSFEPDEGVYTFAWFDQVMDLFAEAGIQVFLDVSVRPAPTWVHKLCPGCNITGKSGNAQTSLRRYMEDTADPGWQRYALRFAKILTERYRSHPALFGFGICNELGDGMRSLSEESRQRFVQWLKKKYGTVEELNRAWATQRWSRRLTSFDDVAFPENELAVGSPESWLDMRRFFSDGIGEVTVALGRVIKEAAPDKPTSSNHYAEKRDMGFDYFKYCDDFVEYPGMGFYPGYETGKSLYSVFCNYMERLGETGKPMWCLEYQSGGQNLMHGPKGMLRMMMMLCLLNRAQMILGWTWRSMLGGEEQFLEGMLGHDGIPTENYEEYRRAAADMKKLEAYHFPYLPEPEIAVSYSFDSSWANDYSSRFFQLDYEDNIARIEELFFRLNCDHNIVDLRNLKGKYRMLIIPQHICMSREEADAIREYVREGGCAVMTAYSAALDETGKAFSTPRPGYLEDVFGIRVASYDRTDTPWNFTEDSIFADAASESCQGRKHELLRIRPAGKEEVLTVDVGYYEKLELRDAESFADFCGGKGCAISVNRYGKGRAFYLATETDVTLLKWLIGELEEELGLNRLKGLPEGVQARKIADGEYFYVNTTGKAAEISLPGSGTGVLTEKRYEGSMVLGPLEAELFVRD